MATDRQPTRKADLVLVVATDPAAVHTQAYSATEARLVAHGTPRGRPLEIMRQRRSRLSTRRRAWRCPRHLTSANAPTADTNRTAAIEKVRARRPTLTLPVRHAY